MPKVNTIKMKSWNWEADIPNKPILTDYVKVEEEIYAIYRVYGKLKNKTIEVTPLKYHFTDLIKKLKENQITEVPISNKKSI